MCNTEKSTLYIKTIYRLGQVPDGSVWKYFEEWWSRIFTEQVLLTNSAKELTVYDN